MFFCEGQSVLQTNIVHDCLGSLYLGSTTLIKTNCKFQIDSTREKIYSLVNNTWVIYSIGTIATNQVCPKAGTLSQMTIKSGQSVTVSHRCHIPTMDHLISTDESEDTEIVNSWLDWTMSLSQLFNHNDNKQLTAMITDLRKHINGNFDASQLLKRLDMVQKPFSADHWRFSFPMAMLGATILIAVIAFAVWRKCCALASHTAPPPLQYSLLQCLSCNLSHNLSHNPNHRCTPLLLRLCRLLPMRTTKIQLSIFRNQRPRCSSTLKQREGMLSFSQFFSELWIFMCTSLFAFIFTFHLCLILLKSTLVLFLLVQFYILQNLLSLFSFTFAKANTPEERERYHT